MLLPGSGHTYSIVMKMRPPRQQQSLTRSDCEWSSWQASSCSHSDTSIKQWAPTMRDNSDTTVTCFDTVPDIFLNAGYVSMNAWTRNISLNLNDNYNNNTTATTTMSCLHALPCVTHGNSHVSHMVSGCFVCYNSSAASDVRLLIQSSSRWLYRSLCHASTTATRHLRGFLCLSSVDSSWYLTLPPDWYTVHSIRARHTYNPKPPLQGCGVFIFVELRLWLQGLKIGTPTPALKNPQAPTLG